MNAKELEDLYNKRIQEADTFLVDAVFPEVRRVCDRYQLEFSAGNGSWTFYFAGNPISSIHSSDGEEFVRLIEPQLIDKLMINLDGRVSLGAIVPFYLPIIEGVDRILIKPDVGFENELGDELIIQPFNCPIPENYDAFGMISIKVAIFIKEAYLENKEEGSALLECLPTYSEVDF